MGNGIAITLWEMLKVGIIANDKVKREEIETIKDIIRKEKNDC
ncbi:hypothetical protein ABE244_26920 [Bacillus toyonensis]